MKFAPFPHMIFEMKSVTHNVHSCQFLRSHRFIFPHWVKGELLKMAGVIVANNICKK